MGNLFKLLLEALTKAASKSKPKPKPKLGQALAETQVPYKKRTEGGMDLKKHPRPEGEELSPGQEQAFLEKMLIEGGMTPEEAKAQFGPYRGTVDFEKGLREQNYPDRFPISQLDNTPRGAFTEEGYKHWPDRDPFELKGRTNAPVGETDKRALPYTRGVLGGDPLAKDKRLEYLAEKLLRDHPRSNEVSESEIKDLLAEFSDMTVADKIDALESLASDPDWPTLNPRSFRSLGKPKDYDRANKDMARFMETFQKLMGKGSSTLNTALLGAGLGAGGLGGALRDKRRPTAGGAPQSPSR